MNTENQGSDREQNIRLGIVGGVFARQFQWHRHPNCTVAAVASQDSDARNRLMTTYECDTAYGSLDEMLGDNRVDAVAVFTDGPSHARHVLRVLEHGKHVISAVPAVWGSIEDAQRLLETVKRTGLTYMMAETSFYHQTTISARRFYREGRFGEIYFAEAEYLHNGFETRCFADGKPTWRYGMAPMHYPTHCTAYLIGVTGERLVEVVCHGWGDGTGMLRDNLYGNPFWNESATFKTDRGNTFRVNIWWKGAHQGADRAKWVGTKMSLYGPHPHGINPVVVRIDDRIEQDDAGFDRQAAIIEPYDQPEWWNTDMLPEPLRVKTGHDGSHGFITHEFIDALVHQRRPMIDIDTALACTVPGIVAHESALRGGELMKIPQLGG